MSKQEEISLLTNPDELIKLAITANSIKGVTVKNRRWMLKTYNDCFVGSEMVDWLMKNHTDITTRDIAVLVGQKMCSSQIFSHVTGDHDFKDETLFYSFDKRVIDCLSGNGEEASWADLLKPVGASSSKHQGELQPNIPNGFVDPELITEKLTEEFHMPPIDEYNIKLVDNCHPPTWQEPTPDGWYNLVVIGAGAGGLVSAAGSAGLGAKVAIIEKHLLGGDCLNFGCVPSKALLRAAHNIAEIRESAEYGISVGDVKVDFPKIMARMRKLRSEISAHDAASRFRDVYKMDVFLGEGKFHSNNTVEVNGKKLKFRKCVIASGAVPALPPIEGLKQANPLTNETVFNLEELPKKLIVIGTGAIGCELAQCFALFGTEVNIFARSNQILAREDADAAKVVQERFVKEGINLNLGVKYSKVEVREDGQKVLHYIQNDENKTVAAEHILVAVGRKPNVDLNLQAAGVNFDPRKGIEVNDYLQTSNKNVYAVGDCCTRYKFTHVADFMARLVIKNTLFFGSDRMSNLVLPWCTYTRPEVAHVGLYEEDLKKKKIGFDTYLREFSDVDRAILDNEGDGFVKILCKSGTDQIVGATIVANHAGEMIGEITLAMNQKIGLSAIASTIHPYPTQAEAIRQCGDAFNRTKLTPTVKMLMRNFLSARR